MKILHIINDEFANLSRLVIDIQSENHEIKVIELSKRESLYEDIIEDIFSCDRVISW